MNERIRVTVRATDPVSLVGIMAQLRRHTDLLVLDEAEMADVVVVVGDDVNPATTALCRASQRRTADRLVLVLARLDEGNLIGAVETGACGLLRRSDASADRLAE